MATSLTSIKDRIKLTSKLLKNETPKINENNATVLTFKKLANSKVSTKILQLYLVFMYRIILLLFFSTLKAV